MGLRGVGWRNGLDRPGSGQGQVAGSCESSSEPSGSIKFGEILEQLRTSQLLRNAHVPWRLSYQNDVYVNSVVCMNFALIYFAIKLKPTDLIFIYAMRDGPRYLSRYSDSVWAGRFRDRSPMGGEEDFSTPVQTGPGAHPASYKMGTESLYRG